MPSLVSGSGTRPKPQQLPTGEVKSMILEDMCYTPKEVPDLLNLYRQKSEECVEIDTE